eukprot:g26129.t1
MFDNLCYELTGEDFPACPLRQDRLLQRPPPQRPLSTGSSVARRSSSSSKTGLTRRPSVPTAAAQVRGQAAYGSGQEHGYGSLEGDQRRTDMAHKPDSYFPADRINVKYEDIMDDTPESVSESIVRKSLIEASGFCTSRAHQRAR